MVTNTSIQKATIERIQVHCRMELGDRFPGLSRNLTIEADEFAAMTADRLVLKLTTYLFGMAAEEDVFRYPATWLDAFKLEFAPTWVLRCWPVQYATHRVKRYQTVCPHTVFEDASRHIHYLGAFPD